MGNIVAVDRANAGPHASTPVRPPHAGRTPDPRPSRRPITDGHVIPAAHATAAKRRLTSHDAWPTYSSVTSSGPGELVASGASAVDSSVRRAAGAVSFFLAARILGMAELGWIVSRRPAA